MNDSCIREQRARLRVSEAERARRAKLSRYRLHLAEIGTETLTAREMSAFRVHSLREYAQYMRDQFSALGV